MAARHTRAAAVLCVLLLAACHRPPTSAGRYASDERMPPTRAEAIDAELAARQSEATLAAAGATEAPAR